MERQALTSTSVVSAGYDPEARVLELEFKTGRVYRYREVPKGVFEWLLRTPSKGAYVSRMIADHYPYEEVHAPTQVGVEHEASLVDALQASLREASIPRRDGPNAHQEERND